MHRIQGQDFLDLDTCKSAHLANMPGTLSKNQTSLFGYGWKGCNQNSRGASREDVLTGTPASKEIVENAAGHESCQVQGGDNPVKMSLQDDKSYVGGHVELSVSRGNGNRTPHQKHTSSSDQEDNNGDETDTTEAGHSSKDAQVVSTLQW
ncbi:hypothetical protein ElyMa_001588400 [Elysia marginata]|uniref:Uncharacterized protein n=1 Tax=Elysia marginata TaxID=1093978 RepID=A0AAV4JHD0_9GAST|nr:hypothetical protein ElyMa_001588400 [Elysia marginata]